MPMTALIVDDERLAREELKYLLDSAGGVEVIVTAVCVLPTSTAFTVAIAWPGIICPHACVPFNPELSQHADDSADRGR